MHGSASTAELVEDVRQSVSVHVSLLIFLGFLVVSFLGRLKGEYFYS